MTLDYDSMDAFERVLGATDNETLSGDYGAQVNVVISLPEWAASRFQEELAGMSSGRAEIQCPV